MRFYNSLQVFTIAVIIGLISSASAFASVEKSSLGPDAESIFTNKNSDKLFNEGALPEVESQIILAETDDAGKKKKKTKKKKNKNKNKKKMKESKESKDKMKDRGDEVGKSKEDMHEEGNGS